MAEQRISEETRARLRAAWPELLGRIAGGEGIGQTIKAMGFSTGMVRAFRDTDKEADAQWQRAKEESADALADEALEVARKAVTIIQPGEPGNERGTQPLVIAADAAFARVRIDTLKWASAKRNPRVYSDKQQLDVNVRTLDLTRIISEANARLAGAPRVRILEHDQGPGAEPVALLAHKALAELL